MCRASEDHPLSRGAVKLSNIERQVLSSAYQRPAVLRAGKEQHVHRA